MKITTTIVCLFFTLMSYCQSTISSFSLRNYMDSINNPNSKNSKTDNCAERLRLAKLSISSSNNRDRFVLFTKNYVNETTDFLQWLLIHEDCYVLNNEIAIKKIKDGYSTIVYKRDPYSETTGSKIKIIYYTTPNDIIKSVSVTGTWDAIADIFIKYWDSDIRPSKKSNEIVYYEILNDRVGFKSDMQGGATIIITNNLGNDIYKQYRSPVDF